MANFNDDLCPNLDLRPAETLRGSGRAVMIVTEPFAGRLGGNQQFVLSETEPGYEKAVARTPDAALHLTWTESFDLRSFIDLELWKQAVFESLGGSVFRS